VMIFTLQVKDFVWSSSCAEKTNRPVHINKFSPLSATLNWWSEFMLQKQESAEQIVFFVNLFVLWWRK
jgi:hypothetical protein